MARSHKGKVKLDIVKLQRYQSKLAFRIQKLQSEAFRTQELISALVETLAPPVETVPAPVIEGGK